ncbi:MAG: sulfite exporter TauE/SafE family protein [Phycisphaerales bacterium]
MNELAIEIVGGAAVGLSLGLLGAGGAIFTVPIFGALLGHAPKAAILEALTVTGMISAVAGTQAGLQREVDLRRVLLLGVPGIVGATLSAPLGKMMPSALQLALFAVVAGVAAWRMWSAAGSGNSHAVAVGTGAAATTPATNAWWRIALIGLGIGVLTSLLGVGGGFLLIPALVLLERLPMRRAVGTSLVVIALNSAAGLAGAQLSGALEAADPMWRAVAIVGACGVAGSIGGRAVAERLPQRALRRAFAVLIAVVAVGTLAQAGLLLANR